DRLPRAVRERVQPVRGDRREAQLVEQRFDARGARPRRRAAIVCAYREVHALVHAQPLEDARHLRLDADAAPRDLVALQADDRFAEELDGSGRRPQLSGERLEQRALAGAVRSDQAQQLAVAYLQVDAVDGDDAAEAHAERARAQQRHGAVRRRAAGPIECGLAHRRLRASARDSSRDPARDSIGVAAISAASRGSSPEGITSTKNISSAPSTRLASVTWLVPSHVVSAWIRMQPTTGPASVPTPPTCAQMMICAAKLMPNTSGPTKLPQAAYSAPAMPAIAAPITNSASLSRRAS